MISWREIQKSNFTCLQQLSEFLQLPENLKKSLIYPKHFKLNLPQRLAAKVTKGTLDDPILKQFLPTIEELAIKDGFCQDPVADGNFKKSPKLLQKYQGRALLVCTSACAMHCRYCFRKNFPYERNEKNFEEELALIRDDITLSEIILSGGDPLSLSNATLNDLLIQLDSMNHVKRIRFHTRFMIGIPERIDASFLNLLQNCAKQIYFIIHCNHPKELDSDIFKALKEIQKSGVVVMNQSVLLKGINDEITILKELSELLANHGIIPYYLHQLDPIQGAAHFQVEEKKGLKLIKELNSVLSGYAVPKYVKEIPGSLGKSLV